VALDGEAVWVADPGRGIPIGIHKTTKISTLTTVLTTLSAGGKMRTGNDSGYSKATGGVHGMGVSITNALSKELIVWTFRDNKWHTQSFAKGKPTSKITTVSKPPILPHVDKKLQFKQGTIIKFVADPTVFQKDSKLELADLKLFLNISSYLIPGIKIYLGTAKKVTEYYQPKGLVAYLENKLTDLKAEATGKVFEYHSDAFDVAMVWSDFEDENLDSFVNGVPTPEGGTHVNGLNQAVMDVLSSFKLKKHKFKSDDLRSGLVGIINVQVMKPQFTTQNKVKLATPEANDMVKTPLKSALSKFFNANKALVKLILQRAHDLAEAKAEFVINKKAISKLNPNKKGKILLPTKLLVATTKQPLEKELFLVEGDSAKGTCGMARDKYYQEVLPLKGKPLNVFQHKAEKIVANDEVSNILMSIGHNPDRKDLGRRVGKVILLADGDDDGHHITVLLSAIMYKMFQPIIDEGNLYAVIAPLWRAQFKGKTYYGYTRKELLSALPGKKGSEKVNMTRFKGWGEAQPEDLMAIAFEPKTRKLVRITSVKGKGKKRFLSVVGSDTDFRKELLGVQ
jgi:DNA gyrase/topoisomerase IV subunit B